MQQSSLTLVLDCDPETLWTVLGDMVRNPGRYEERVTLKRTLPGDSQVLTRVVERAGVVMEEVIEFHLDALMVELTTRDPDTSLIHQIVPAGAQTILNLAITEAPLDPGSRRAETGDTRLEALGARIKEVAEQLST